MTYRVKKTVRQEQRVILRDNLRPTGRKIFLDNATQAQLEFLYNIDHPFVEIVPKKNEKIESKKIESKKPEDKEIKIKTSGTDKS